MDKESISVSAIKMMIAKTDFLTPFINEKDKEPSWDGNVYVYRNAGNVHAKTDMVGKIPVQVKGHVKKETLQDGIKESVCVSDLKQYLTEGGTIYIVVYMDKEGENIHIYYNKLLPFDLRKLLNVYGQQDTCTISLKHMPIKKEDITDLFLNFLRDRDMQRAAINAEDFSIEDIIKTGNLKELTFGYTSVKNNGHDLFDYLFTNSTYLYAKLPYGITLPVEHIEHFEAAGTEIEGEVGVKDRIYYSKFGIVYKVDKTELLFGKSSSLIIEKSDRKLTFKFTMKGTLLERICDLSFIIDAVETGAVKINGQEISLGIISSDQKESLQIDERKYNLEFMQLTKSVLDSINVSEDLDCDQMTQQDQMNLRILISAIHDKNLVSINEAKQPIGYFKVSNLNLLVALVKDDESGLYRMYNLFDAPLVFKGCDDSGNEFDSSVYTMLKKEDFLKASNINYDAMFCEIKEILMSSLFANQLLHVALCAISAYDIENREAFLKFADDIFQWLEQYSEFEDDFVIRINRLQIAKRRDALSHDGKKQLCEIIENKNDREDILTAAYLLLDNKLAAEIHFANMTKFEQKEFNLNP